MSLHAQSLRIDFEKPASGWMRCRVTTGSGDAEIFVSHTPNDFIRELLNALLNATEFSGSFEAVANEEPRQVAFAFGRSAGRIELTGYDRTTGEVLVSFSGSPADVLVPFWRSLRRLQSDWADAEWQWHFPEGEMTKLGAVVGIGTS